MFSRQLSRNAIVMPGFLGVSNGVAGIMGPILVSFHLL
jgi:hypothetical protein